MNQASAEEGEIGIQGRGTGERDVSEYPLSMTTGEPTGKSTKGPGGSLAGRIPPNPVTSGNTDIKIVTSNTKEEVLITRRLRDIILSLGDRRQDGKKTFRICCHHRSIFIKVNLSSTEFGGDQTVLRQVALLNEPINETDRDTDRHIDG